MEIVRTVRARDGDTLCSIAVENGFRNCNKLRTANPALASRQLRSGDRVDVPAVTQKSEPGATELLHRFVRHGALANRIWIIQDHNRGTPEAAVGDQQRELAVCNYVTGRQGSGFAPQVWKLDFGHDANASVDPDHFKLQVFDRQAADRGEATVQATLQTQKPVLGAVRNEIARWDDLTDPGTKLENIDCQQVEPNSPWYRSRYMRLVVDRSDQNGRAADGTDPADDRTIQTLVVPPIRDGSGNPDPQLEILDERVRAERPAPDCEVADANARCRALTTAAVGKEEKVLKVKVFRITGSGADANAITNPQINTMLFRDYRLVLAQANVGIEVLSITDVPPPRNMIAVSDLITGGERRATGGNTIGATVRLSTGNVSANITTVRNETPRQTAQRLANALTAQGVTCRVSPNPPELQGDPAFGSCDLLCFNADRTPAPIVAVNNSAAEAQQLTHTGGWNNSSVRDGSEYGGNEPRVRFVGGLDFRAAAKNYNTETGHLSIILVNLFAPLPPPPGGGAAGTLLGFALIPYREVTAGFRPIREMTMAVFLDRNGATRRTVLPHEAGHSLLDAIHTTDGNNPEGDFATPANVFPANTRLAFSEWMAAFSRETSPPFMHTRMSDSPLTVEILLVINMLGFDGNAPTRQLVMGTPPNDTAVRRFRNLSASVLGSLRRLREAPETPL